jgi:hypothetical protein
MEMRLGEKLSKQANESCTVNKLRSTKERQFLAVVIQKRLEEAANNGEFMLDMPCDKKWEFNHKHGDKVTLTVANEVKWIMEEFHDPPYLTVKPFRARAMRGSSDEDWLRFEWQQMVY